MIIVYSIASVPVLGVLLLFCRQRRRKHVRETNRTKSHLNHNSEFITRSDYVITLFYAVHTERSFHLVQRS